jgi:prepilin-type N-terminal cleavage/methylation domain-containing protein
MKRQAHHFRKPRTGRGQGGFTLIEVIVTIVIAAIMGVFFVQFVGTSVIHSAAQPYRVRVRPPSFVNLQALDRMIRGGLVADVVAVIGTLDIVLGEVDR